MRISDWSSDVCSSDLNAGEHILMPRSPARIAVHFLDQLSNGEAAVAHDMGGTALRDRDQLAADHQQAVVLAGKLLFDDDAPAMPQGAIEGSTEGDLIADAGGDAPAVVRSEEHTSELQSLMRISYAVFCLK